MYFKVTTNITTPNGIRKVFDMNKQCNYVLFDDDTLCKFMYNTEEGSKLLMLMPYENIAYIEQIEEDEKNDE